MRKPINKKSVRQENPEFPETLTVKETALLTTYSKSGVHSLIKNGKIKAVKSGRRVIIYKESVLSFLLGLQAINPINKPQKRSQDEE